MVVEHRAGQLALAERVCGIGRVTPSHQCTLESVWEKNALALHPHSALLHKQVSFVLILLHIIYNPFFSSLEQRPATEKFKSTCNTLNWGVARRVQFFPKARGRVYWCRGRGVEVGTILGPKICAKIAFFRYQNFPQKFSGMGERTITQTLVIQRHFFSNPTTLCNTSDKECDFFVHTQNTLGNSSCRFLPSSSEISLEIQRCFKFFG